jgi:threonine dehydrogenase-like Zn-dependent dehydrogenase
MRVEACGLCGSDIEYFAGEQVIGATKYPRILGHEVVGVIEEIGGDAEQRSGVHVGDRVALDPTLSCGTCSLCLRQDNRMFCRGYSFQPAFYGTVPTTIEPGLWGGYASHLYVHPDAVLYPVPADCDPLTASLWNALAAGVQWAVTYPQTKVGTSIAILGCGQRGLACVIAARSAGASPIIVTGLERDEHKLNLAERFGADVSIVADRDNVEARVLEATRGLGADVVVDVASGSPTTAAQAISLVRPGGYVVFYGIKSGEVPAFPINSAIYKGITIQAATGLTRDSFRRGVDLLTESDVDLTKLRTHVFPTREVETALGVLGGKADGELPINVVLTPDW